jgi:hypothetical protein
MDVISADWSVRHQDLGKMIRKKESAADAINLALDLHSELHMSAVSGSTENTVDLIFKDLQNQEYAVMLSSRDETIAWAVWHIARIEDLTMNILANSGAQIFNTDWANRMQTAVTDTGNAMTDEEIMQFSRSVCKPELLNYRNAVGMQSRNLLKKWQFEDLRRKVSPHDISRVLKEGGVTGQKDSVWLLDFWGKKDVAGLIMMPLTRHQTCHLNDCYKWKQTIRKKKTPKL